MVYRLGRPFGRPLGPGLVVILPCIDEHQVVDLRTHTYDIPSQEMLTRDSVTVTVDAAVYIKTTCVGTFSRRNLRDPLATISCVTDANASTRQLTQTTLRSVFGTRTLAEVMSDREGIAREAQLSLGAGDHNTSPEASAATQFWGITVERVEVKDIRLPRELCRAMAAEAEASREAEAKYISAQGELGVSLKSHKELQASVALSRAATELASSPAAIQLRFMQTLVHISAHKNHTVVVPVPGHLLRERKAFAVA